MEIEMREIIPEISHTGSKIEIIEKEKTLIVFWKNKHRHPKPTEIPKRLPLTTELISLMGFWLGDGLKGCKGGSIRTVSFTNSDPTVVKWAMKVFEIFNLSPAQLTASVSVRTLSEANEDEIKKFWSEITGIPTHKISVNVRKSLRKNLRNLPLPKEFGSIKIEFHSAVLRDIIISLLEFCKNISLQSKLFAFSFLKGLLAADGSSVDRGIVISSMNTSNKSFIRKLLKICGINPKERKDGIEISKRRDLLKMKDMNIFEIHPERNQRFMNSF